MKYGFDIDGIIGLDFLIETKAIIDFSQLELRTSNSQKENLQ
jgi:hypothetical protein